VTLKRSNHFFHNLSCSMIRSLFSCHSTYFRICSSSSPTVLTQYPFAQKRRPQYRRFSSWCLSNILIALLPFRKPTNSDTEYFGGIDRTRWIWSTWLLPASISTLFHTHSCFMMSRTGLPTFRRSKSWNDTSDTRPDGIYIAILHVRGNLSLNTSLWWLGSPTHILQRYSVFGSL
jgi:hypothetical protein